MAQSYLTEFYEGELHSSSKRFLEFYATIYQELAGGSFLEFGGGPTIYSLISAARYVDSIHFTDYSAESLAEVNKWLEGDPDTFDWRDYTSYALQYEEGSDAKPSPERIQARHDLIRQRIKKVTRSDAFADDPLLGESEAPYDVVANTCCLNGLTDKPEIWLQLNQKVTDLLAPGGTFLTCALLNASYWTVGDVRYPSVRLRLADVTDMYQMLGFSVTYREMIEVKGHPGYGGSILVSGRKK